MTIATILTTKGGDVVRIAPDATVGEAVTLLAGRRIGALPVVEDGAVVGVISERDLLYGVAARGAALLDQLVGTVMTAPAITVARDTPTLAALALMTRRRIRHLPVVEAGVLVGIVSIGDLVKARMDRMESEAASLRDYIASA